MKIKALKAGRFAHPVPSLPQIVVEIDGEYPVDDQIGQAMIDKGWANEVNDKPVEPVAVPKKTVKKEVKKKIKGKK